MIGKLEEQMHAACITIFFGPLAIVKIDRHFNLIIVCVNNTVYSDTGTHNCS